MEYTEKQQKAIGTRGKSVLVSAAAGSGKTSVLTARIVSLISEGADIRNMLIATFTNAAAGEMKTRIARALLRAGDDKRIREQSELVMNANIGTFHSLCSRIIRENYNILGISHSYKILSDRETQNLRAESMDELLDDLYEFQDDDFLRILERYANRGADEAVQKMVLKLYDFAMAKPDPGSWLSAAAGKTYEEYCELAGGNTPEIRDEYDHTMTDVRVLTRMAQDFGDIFAAKKAEKNAFDYDDLLHMALRALEERSYNFDYIFVDEFQDTNPVQEEIIRRLAREDNLFMVGDIKQSIYKFNLADPEIFLKKAVEFKNPLFEGELLCMNENFRSASQVVDAVNQIMCRVMSPDLGEIEYTPDEMLICKNGDEGAVQALVCETGRGAEKSAGEAAAVADAILSVIGKKIRINGKEREIRYGDIALLVRARNDFTEAVKKVFYSRNIPLMFDLEEKKELPELDLFVNVLRIIENPAQDVPLLSVLRSFAGGFDENELAAVRLYKQEGPFWAAAEEYVKNQTDGLAQKLRRFFGKIASLKIFAAGESFADFISKTADAFEFDDYMLCISGDKREAFKKLVGLCAELGEARGGSLYLVNRALLETRKRDGCYVKTKPAGGGDAVRLMTMHHSKGLEFPVVFLCSLHKQFNMRDLFSNAQIVIHSQMGVLPNYVDPEKCVCRSTAARNAAIARLKAEYKSEELRILYVAMTRAKNMLYLCGCVPDELKAFEKWNEYASGSKQFLEANCMLDWVMGALPPHIPVARITPGEQTFAEKPALNIEKLNGELLAGGTPEKEIVALPARIKVPAKLSVSEIKKQESPLRISIRAVKNENEITGAKLGTLVHAVMEHIDFKGDNALAAAERLFSREIITQAERDAIQKNAGMIDAFFTTSLAQRIRQSGKVIKEMPFNVLLPANEVGYESALKVTVQGVLDLAFMEEGEWVLVDYKTDRIDGNDPGELQKMYRKQLSLYAGALEKITGIPVKQRYLCFLRNNLQIKV